MPACTWSTRPPRASAPTTMCISSGSSMASGRPCRGATCSTRRCCCNRSDGRPTPRASPRRAPRSSTCCGSRASAPPCRRSSSKRTRSSAPPRCSRMSARAGLQPLARADDRTPIFATEALARAADAERRALRRQPRRGFGLRLARTDAADASVPWHRAAARAADAQCGCRRAVHAVPVQVLRAPRAAPRRGGRRRRRA